MADRAATPRPGLERDLTRRLASELRCPEAIASILVARGITDHVQAEEFLHPTLALLGDPLSMRHIDLAVRRIQSALAHGEPILIYGDYDVDGTTATALLKKSIEIAATGDRPAVVTYHVPHRIKEGYGMQESVLARAAGMGVRLIISVDTGIRAFAAAAEAKQQGIDLIVTDHHLPDGAAGVPEAHAVVNPAQEGCPYPFKSLCGAAVAFKLAHALLRASARDAAELNRVETVLVPSLLKLVAIATIADSVPLQGENRAMVALGLRELKNPVQPGLRALFAVAQIPEGKAPTPSQVGFRLAPRMNAAGRMDVADDVVELLLTRDVENAKRLAEKLEQLNTERRAVEAYALESIEQTIGRMRRPDGSFRVGCMVLDDPDWHRGVIGILASRVVDRTQLPALVLTHEDGQAYGSGRSVAGFHLLEAITAIHREMGRCGRYGDSPFFSRFGGHAHAVGFSLASERVDALREALETHASGLALATTETDFFGSDLEVCFESINEDFFDWITKLGPFGMGNPEPVFVSKSVVLSAPVRVIQGKHVSLQLSSPSSTGKLTAVGWSRATDWVTRCSSLRLEPGSRVDISFRLREKANPQYGLFELELIDLRAAS